VAEGDATLSLAWRHGYETVPRGGSGGGGHLATRLAAVLVVPQTLAGLERLAAQRAAVWTHVGVDALVRAHRRRVLEPAMIRRHRHATSIRCTRTRMG